MEALTPFLFGCLGAALVEEEGEHRRTAMHFNGKIEAPAVFDRAVPADALSSKPGAVAPPSCFAPITARVAQSRPLVVAGLGPSHW